MIQIDEIAKRDAQKIKELSELAKKFIIELNAEHIVLGTEDFEIEEVIHRDEKWIVSVSYFRKIKEPNELQKTLGILGRRVYKRITIDWKKRQVLGMSDWTPELREAA